MFNSAWVSKSFTEKNGEEQIQRVNSNEGTFEKNEGTRIKKITGIWGFLAKQKADAFRSHILEYRRWGFNVWLWS